MLYRIYFLIFILFGALFTQNDRSTIYHNGSPIGVETFNLIYKNDSLDVQFSNQFSVPNDYILERFSFYFGFEEYPDSIFAQLHEDDNQSPGEIIDEWQIVINSTYPNGAGYNLFTLDECIQLNIGSSYWITVKSKGNGVLKWLHTEESWPNVNSMDGGETWSNVSISPLGASIVYAEQIYYQDPIWGDVNGDLIQNVVDVIQMVQFVLGTLQFDQNQFFKGDLNQDGEINIIDIISVVSFILNTTPPMVQYLSLHLDSNHP